MSTVHATGWPGVGCSSGLPTSCAALRGAHAPLRTLCWPGRTPVVAKFDESLERVYGLLPAVPCLSVAHVTRRCWRSSRKDVLAATDVSRLAALAHPRLREVQLPAAGCSGTLLDCMVRLGQ
jgi:hypothetical protein